MKKAVRTIISFIEDTLPGLMLLAIVLLVAVDVGSRYLFNSPLRGVSEVALISMVWIIMLGSARAVNTYQHIAVEALIDQFHGRAKAAISLATIVLVIAILGTIFFIAVPYVLETLPRTFPTLAVSRGFITAAVPIGLALMIAHYSFDIARLVRDLRDGGTRYFDRMALSKNSEFESLMPVTEKEGQLP